MELGLKVLVLLAFAFTCVLCDDGDDDTVYCDCPANTYENDDNLIRYFDGDLYTHYSTGPLGDNEIFNCQRNRKNIFVRTTVDNECCRTFNVTLKPTNYQRTDPTAEYFTYLIETAATGCSVRVDEFAHLKMIALKKDRCNKTYCFLLWTCRESRQGVHAFCNAQKISDKLRSWILNEYKKTDSSLVPQVVNQNTDYRDGVCFQ